MKRTLLFIMCVLASLTMSAQDGLTVENIQNSGCMAEARAEDYVEPIPTIVLEKEGSVLSVQLLNYKSDCCTEDFKVTSSISGGSDGEPCSVSISAAPVDGGCDCICPYNVSFTVRDLEPNSFYLNCWWYAGEVNLKDGEPLILEDAYESVTIDGINYKLRKAFRFAMLTGGELVGELSIPSELSYEGETYSVMSISSNAFRDNTALTKVYIPKTIRNMDTWGKSGFGMNPFYSCMSLETIEVEEGNPELCSVDGVLFNKDKTTLIGYPVASPRESYSVPESVKAVASAAFYSNLFLKEIDLPESINYFGSIAFRNFSNLKDIYCHAKKVPGTDIYAFEGVNFSQITLHVPATSIENYQATSPWSQFGSIVPLEAQMAYHPFLKEGKTWNYQEYYHNVWDEEQWTKNFSYVINGTTEIDGKTYYKMYKGSNYYCALREENRKVWMRTNDGDDRLLYDFGMSVGDSYKPYNEWSTFQLVAISPMRFNDELLNVFHYDVTTDYFGNGETVNVYPYSIVEGVGCDMGWNILELFYEVPSNGIIIREDFLSCYEDDKCIFTADDFKDLTNTKPEDDYIPFVASGKSWHVVRSDLHSGCHLERYQLINEEVVKNGKTYMKMYRSEDDLTVVYDTGLFREENRKVYRYDTDKEEEILMFDYSLKAGDTYETYSYDEQEEVTYKVLSVSDYQEGPKVIHYINGTDGRTTQPRYLRKWTVCRTDNEALQKTWIEGVGSLEGPLGNLRDVVLPDVSFDYLAYVDDGYGDLYLPFSFQDTWSRQAYGCDLPTGAENNEEDDRHHKLTYELDGDRLHVYGEVFCNCGPNHYAFFYEKPTDDPLVHKIEFEIENVEPLMWCVGLHATDFYVPGFDPDMNYIVVDNNGEEHPVIKKTQQVAYRPFVEEGKVWKVGSKDSGNPVKFVAYYYFDGDTIIGGKTCKQMMCQRYVSPDRPNTVYYDYWAQLPSLSKVGAWYEEDQKVYVCREGTQGMQMLYDFSLEANDTLILNDYQPDYIVGPKQTGGLNGFKGIYRDIMLCGGDYYITTWLEGVGGIDGPLRNVYPETESDPQFLMSCTVGDEVIYLNDEYEDGATPGCIKDRKRFDFTHTIKTQPKAPIKRVKSDAFISSSERELDRPEVKAPRKDMGARTSSSAEEGQTLYGEYNDQQLSINLNPLDEAYTVYITDESGKVAYEKSINAGNIVGLSIDISTYAAGRYTVTVENSQESFTGQFEALTTGISDAERLNDKGKMINDDGEMINNSIYNLQGQRLSSLQKGLNIVNKQKVYVK